jgi:3-phenylpropionate/trans-cinnamate dioxygenase ferredoxin subunit
MSEFVTVGKLTDLEEVEMRSFEVDGQIITVAVVDDKYYAFDDTCTHEPCSLADGDISGTTVICPCCDGEFDVVTGEVLDGPPEEPIMVYPVQVAGDEVQVEL